MEDRTFDLGGRTLAYLDSGGDGPVIVLVHGGGDNAETWHELFPALRALGRVVAPDLAGHGRSDDTDPATDHAPPDLHTDVHRLIDEGLGVTGPVLLVGHSLGASIVLALARLRPAHAVLLLDGAPHRGLLGPPVPFDPVAFEARLRELGLDVTVTVDEVEALATADPHPPVLRRSFVRRAEDGRYEGHPTIPFRVRLGAMGARVDNPYRDLALFTDVPVRALALQGDHGNQADVRDVVEDLARANPNLELRWLDAGHSLHWDRPDAVVDAVRELLDGS
jgi:pimeloyl-ACP methyl ester carboxylesterase